MARPTKPGNLERGWNDPPVFLYNTGPPADPASTATAPKRHPLTKRIAYTEAPPSGSVASVEAGLKEPPPGPQTDSNTVAESGLVAASTASSTSLLEDNFPQVQLFPPSNTTELPRFAAPIIVPTMIHGSSVDGIVRPVPVIATNPVSGGVHVAANDATDVLQIPNFDDDEQMFHYVITRLHRAIRDCQAVVEPKVLEDIQKKVNILSDLWKNGKVSYPVKCTMARLSTAIHRRQCTVAQELHLALMIDHVSEVSKWLVGIKRLIQEVEKVEQPLSPSSVCFPTNDETPFKSLATQPTEAIKIQPTDANQLAAEANQPAAEANQPAAEPADLVPVSKSESPADESRDVTRLPTESHDMNRLVGEQVELTEASNTERKDADSVTSSLEGPIVTASENLSTDPTLSEASVG